jgi:hypothetical protein
MSPQIKKGFASIIRKQCPSAKILELCPLHEGRVLEDADSWLDVPTDVPRELAERVAELAEKRKRRDPIEPGAASTLPGATVHYDLRRNQELANLLI